MKDDKQIVKLVSLNIKEITISKVEFDELKDETKKLLRLNNIKINIEDEK